jgi:4'-phosphopantetheinyl transferase
MRVALYAFAFGRDLGVDVERLRRIEEADQMMERFFSPGERDAIRAMPADERNRAFLRCWTRKEAYVKALGAGLTRPLDAFSVPLGPEESAQPMAIQGSSEETSHWFVQGLMPVPGYVAAVVAKGDGWKCQ